VALLPSDSLGGTLIDSTLALNSRWERANSSICLANEVRAPYQEGSVAVGSSGPEKTCLLAAGVRVEAGTARGEVGGGGGKGLFIGCGDGVTLVGCDAGTVEEASSRGLTILGGWEVLGSKDVTFTA
jgi:hypothetical protein